MFHYFHRDCRSRELERNRPKPNNFLQASEDAAVPKRVQETQELRKVSAAWCLCLGLGTEVQPLKGHCSDSLNQHCSQRQKGSTLLKTYQIKHTRLKSNSALNSFSMSAITEWIRTFPGNLHSSLNSFCRNSNNNNNKQKPSKWNSGINSALHPS